MKDDKNNSDKNNSIVKLCMILVFLFSESYIYSQSEKEMLEKAYKGKLATELKDFFIAWSQDVSPIADVELSAYSEPVVL